MDFFFIYYSYSFSDTTITTTYDAEGCSLWLSPYIDNLLT